MGLGVGLGGLVLVLGLRRVLGVLVDRRVRADRAVRVVLGVLVGRHRNHSNLLEVGLDGGRQSDGRWLRGGSSRRHERIWGGWRQDPERMGRLSHRTDNACHWHCYESKSKPKLMFKDSQQPYLSTRDLFPDVGSARAAELEFIVHVAVHMLGVVVDHRDGDHGNQRGHSAHGHAAEAEAAQTVGLLLLDQLIRFRHGLGVVCERKTRTTDSLWDAGRPVLYRSGRNEGFRFRFLLPGDGPRCVCLAWV
uniref:Secreted protein n=1 Tax=Bursaphelenchus xylophilus TaxID=6326 RepID=A0A1I7RJU2_BURXY